MFLVALIILLIICTLGSTRTIMKRKTANDRWGEPVVTILQVLLLIAMIVVLTFDHMMQ